jgi:ATP-binding cassette subfamily B protein
MFAYNYSIFQIRDVVRDLTNGGNSIDALLKILIILSLPIILEPATFFFKRVVFVKVVADLNMELYSNVMKLDYSFHTDKETGRLISKMLRVEEIMNLFIWQIEWFLVNSTLSFLVPIIILSFISWQVGAFVFIALIVGLPIEIWALKKNVKCRSVARDKEYDKNSVIVDTLTNYETVRLFGKVDGETNNLSNSLKHYQVAFGKYQQSFMLIDFSARLSGILMFCAGTVLGYMQMKAGTIDIASFVVIITYLLSLSTGTVSLIFSLRTVFNSMPIVEDLYDLLQEKKSIAEPETPYLLANPQGTIAFKDVSFKYAKRQDLMAISNLNLKIQGGSSVAFVGPSGGGKSTMTKLLLRYYLPSTGEISIDGVDINDLGTDGINNLIGVVPQDPILFNRSLKYNIGYALGSSEEALDSQMSEIIDAAKRAMIHEFIETLPEKYDTIVGERGVKLSGGQKQRVAIARVLLKNPKIVIFDEATSMLDSESEGAIQKAFKELVKNTTTIIIAHRLSTIKNVDKIFVIDKGRLVEQGTHTELIDENKIYAKLWAMQSSGFKK